MQTQEVNSAKYFLVEVPEGTVNGGEGREQRRVRQGCGDFTYFIKGLPHRLLGTSKGRNAVCSEASTCCRFDPVADVSIVLHDPACGHSA